MVKKLTAFDPAADRELREGQLLLLSQKICHAQGPCEPPTQMLRIMDREVQHEEVQRI